MLKQEEERFAETLENGMGVLEAALASGEKLLDGETVFQLYDTFGFPVDLTADIAASAACASTSPASRRRWRSSASGARGVASSPMAAGLEYSGGKTEFHGYDTLTPAGQGGRALPRGRARARR